MTFLKILNIILILVNGVVFFMPKKPMSGVHSNAAGILALMALTVMTIMVIHLVLFVVAVYYNKGILLKIITFVMMPLSLICWYFVFMK